MDASTRPTWHTSLICWPRKTPPCAPSWFAATFPSTAACLPATALSKDSRLLLIPAARAARHPQGTATNATVVALALTRAAPPLPPLNSRSIPGSDSEFDGAVYTHNFRTLPPPLGFGLDLHRQPWRIYTRGRKASQPSLRGYNHHRANLVFVFFHLTGGCDFGAVVSKDKKRKEKKRKKTPKKHAQRTWR